MSLNNSNDAPDMSTSTQMPLSTSIMFWTYLVLDIPSTICLVFVLCQFLTRKTLYRAMNNHTIIAITISSLGTNLIDIPFALTYARLGFVWPPMPVVCIGWWFTVNCNYATTNILLAWASFERHILIFHEKWLSTKKGRWLIHYIPLIFLSVYPSIFYVAVVFIPSCNYKFVFDYTLPVCGWIPCYASQTAIVMYDLSINGVLPNIVIAICSIGLLIRVIWHRHIRNRQPIQWQKYRKLSIQMLSLSIVFLIFNLPYLIYVIMEYGNFLPLDINSEIFAYLIFLTGFCMLFLPFITLLSLPDEYWLKKCREKLTTILHSNTVSPTQQITLTTTHVRRTQLN